MERKKGKLVIEDGESLERPDLKFFQGEGELAEYLAEVLPKVRRSNNAALSDESRTRIYVVDAVVHE